MFGEGGWFWGFDGGGYWSGVGGEDGAILVSERKSLFGGASNCEDAAVMALMATVAKVDHVLNRRCSIDSVFENVVGLGLADTETFWNPAWPIAIGKVSILPPVGMMRSGNKPGW